MVNEGFSELQWHSVTRDLGHGDTHDDTIAALDACSNSADCLRIELEVDEEEMQKLESQPLLFIAQKIRSAEVTMGKLTPEDRELFLEAKAREVSEFVGSEAVCRCESQSEVEEAWSSRRLMRARWLLSWKSIQHADRPKALLKRCEEQDSGGTVVRADGTCKAKARIMILGFEHPDFATKLLQSSSPVAAQATKMLALNLAVAWEFYVECVDATSAFLQAARAELSRRVWTTSVPESSMALGELPRSILLMAKAVYGVPNAPRVFCEDVKGKLEGLGCVPIMGGACCWLVVDPAQQEHRGICGIIFCRAEIKGGCPAIDDVRRKLRR